MDNRIRSIEVYAQKMFLFFQVVIAFLVWSNSVQNAKADGYHVLACSGSRILVERQLGHRAVRGVWTPSNEEHFQGNTNTCGFHSAAILLGALVQENISVIDMIVKMGKELDGRSSVSDALSFFKAHQGVARNLKRTSIAKVSGVFDGLSQAGTSVSIANWWKPTEEITLHSFNINVFNRFKNLDEITHTVIDHFKRSSLPLNLSVCGNDDTDPECGPHSVAVTGVKEVYCEDQTGPFVVVDFLNSLGDPIYNGPFLLDSLAQGILRYSLNLPRFRGH